ncbi:hypothetical protein GNF76_28415 [Pseudomonas sp. CCM 7893]|uniref:Uncharacterized protein n=1 Tax=Pseudomonas spelaei TaxID=1055469 RepID=A0A6I3WLM3_9PSED|nr:hypothetical protein [Pseudomonas spelaei]
MLQLGDPRGIDHFGCGAMDVMNESRLFIGANMGLHTEELLVTFLGLLHLGIALSVFVLYRARARITVASTTVPWRSDWDLSCK